MNSENINKNIFETPTFSNRVRSMLKLDFYRLFHTPVFYIMLGIAALIPAMVLSLSAADVTPPASSSPHSANVPQIAMPVFENT